MSSDSSLHNFHFKCYKISRIQKIIQTLHIFITLTKINSTQATSTQHIYQKVWKELIQTLCHPLWTPNMQTHLWSSESHNKMPKLYYPHTVEHDRESKLQLTNTLTFTLNPRTSIIIHTRIDTKLETCIEGFTGPTPKFHEKSQTNVA